jgi:hypothetical protein
VASKSSDLTQANGPERRVRLGPAPIHIPGNARLGHHDGVEAAHDAFRGRFSYVHSSLLC